MEEEKLGSIIKQKRINGGLKQVELAEKIGISRTYLSDIENNRYIPSTKLLFKINKELQLFILLKSDGNTIQKIIV